MASSHWKKEWWKNVRQQSLYSSENFASFHKSIFEWVIIGWTIISFFQIVLGDAKQQEKKTTKAQEYTPNGYKMTKKSQK